MITSSGDSRDYTPPRKFYINPQWLLHLKKLLSDFNRDGDVIKLRVRLESKRKQFEQRRAHGQT